MSQPNQNHASSQGFSDWTGHPDLSEIDPVRLSQLQSLAASAENLLPEELPAFLLSASAQLRNRKLRFSPEEIDAIITVLKIGKPPEEIRRLEKICSLLQLSSRCSKS